MLGRPRCAVGYWIDVDLEVRLSLKTFASPSLRQLELLVFR